MCLPFVRRPRVCLSLRRAERVATRARTHEAMRRSMHVLRVAKRSRPGMFRESTSGLQACASVLRLVAMSTAAASDVTGDFASGSGSKTLSSGTGMNRGGARAHACCVSISAALVR
eukprot:3608964-Pleurochrysis_carterae.AAC.1